MCVFAEGNRLFAQGATFTAGSIFRVERTAKGLRLRPSARIPLRQSPVNVIHVSGGSDDTGYPIVDALRDFIDMFGTEIASGVGWQLNPSFTCCAVRSHFYKMQQGLKRSSAVPSPDGNGLLFFGNERAYYVPQFDQVSYEYYLTEGELKCTFGSVRRQLDTGLARDLTTLHYLNRHWLFTDVEPENTLHLVADHYLLQRTQGRIDHWSCAPAAASTGKPSALYRFRGSWGVVLPRYLHYQFARYALLTSRIERQYLVGETYATLRSFLQDIEHWVVSLGEAAEARKIVREFEKFARINGFLLEDAKETLLRAGEATTSAPDTLLKPAMGPSATDPDHLLRAAEDPEEEE